MKKSFHKVCERADRALKHNPLDVSRAELMERCGLSRSTYYYGVKHGVLTLEAFAKLADESALTDEQILSVFREGRK